MGYTSEYAQKMLSNKEPKDAGKSAKDIARTAKKPIKKNIKPLGVHPENIK